MKLSAIAIDKIKDSRSLPKKLAVALDVSRTTIWKYIRENDDELTKAVALKIIKQGTGLTEEEILEPEAAEA